MSVQDSSSFNTKELCTEIVGNTGWTHDSLQIAPVWPQSGMCCGGYACTWPATAPRSFQHWQPCYESCRLRWTRVDPSRRALQQCHQEISSFAAAQKHLAELYTQQRGIPHPPSNIIMIITCVEAVALSHLSVRAAASSHVSSFWAKQEWKGSKMFRPHLVFVLWHRPLRWKYNLTVCNVIA